MNPGGVSTGGISVVVPVFNAEATLVTLFGRLSDVLHATGAPFEVIFVDDGSRDRSWTVVESLSREHNNVSGIRMMRNYGQHNALLCGIRAARYASLVTLDDDLQNPPEEIPKLLGVLAQGMDVVYGVPERQQHGLLRYLASRITKIVLSSGMGAETAGKVSAFRAFRTELRRGFASYSSPYVSIDVLLTWAGRRFASVRVRHDGRAAGESNYTTRKLVAHAMNMMTGFSILPLQLASIIGFVFTGFGIMILMIVLIRYLTNPVIVPGFSFLASIIVIFSGAQLSALGILGEYIARIHVRTMDRPGYTVGATTDGVRDRVATEDGQRPETLR